MGADDRRVALEALEIRAELKSADLDENTAQIEREAVSRAPKSSSTPAPARGIVAVLNVLPPWGRVFILALLIGFLGGSGLWALLGRLGWMK